MDESENETKLLVVEDDPHVVRAIQRLMPPEIRCFAAGTVQDAFAFLTLNGPFHGLIADIRLPDGTGWEVAEAWNKSYPASPAMIITGFADLRSTANRAASINARFVAKPFGGAELHPFANHVLTTRWDVPTKIVHCFARFVTLHKLTKKQRSLFAAYSSNIRGRQIAETLGISKNTMKSNIRQFLRRVRAATMELAYDAMLRG